MGSDILHSMTCSRLAVLWLAASLLPCAPCQAAMVAAWGFNANGQTDLPIETDYQTVTGGLAISLGLTTNGAIVGSGWDGFGIIRNIPEGEDYVGVSAGLYHAVAIRADGSLKSWGGADGHLFVDLPVPEGNDFVKAAAGHAITIALRADGSLAAVGWTAKNEIEDVPPGDDFVDIAAGGMHALALRGDGSIVAWGDNLSGQADPPGGNDFEAIAAGASHSLALKTGGSLVAWGLDDYGQVDVPAGTDYVGIAAGFVHNLALRKDGTIVAWGRNDFGECDVPPGDRYIAIAAGADHSLALVIPEPAAFVMILTLAGTLAVFASLRRRWR